MQGGKKAATIDERAWGGRGNGKVARGGESKAPKKSTLENSDHGATSGVGEKNIADHALGKGFTNDKRGGYGRGEKRRGGQAKRLPKSKKKAGVQT